MLSFEDFYLRLNFLKKFSIFIKIFFSRSRLSSTSHSETEQLQLSPEQEHMRTVFTSLIKNCKENPTLQAAFKRKLDDVEKRLETLYEMNR